MSKVFLDTNILVYSLDTADSTMQKVCRNLIVKSIEDGQCVISTQVMQEFYVVATTKLGVKATAAKAILRSLDNLEVVVVAPDLVHEAAELAQRSKISLWNALIIVSASSAGCEILYSEDLNHGQVLRGVRVTNPLRIQDGFPPARE